MTQMQTTWRDVDISAYVDGELDPAAQAAFEVALAQDHALRQKVDEMREVVALVRAIPLREPPRNYLLTPSMVAEKSVAEKSPRRVQRRSTPLLFMRLATSLAAAAFVVTAGLTYMQRGITPTMMSEAPQAAYEMPATEAQRAVVEVTKEVEVMRASEPEEMPAEPASVEEGVQAEKVVESEEVALAQTPAPAPAAAVLPPSAGGADETAAMNAQEQEEATPQPEILALKAAPVAEEQTADKAESTVEDSTGTLSGTGEGEWMAYDTAEPTTADHYGMVTAEPSHVDPWRLPVILGAVTLLLAGVTYWISRRR